MTRSLRAAWNLNYRTNSSIGSTTTKTFLTHVTVLTMVIAACVSTHSAAAAPGPAFAIAEKDFVLGDQPFVIRSGELHYARIPREYWVHRLRMAKALGLNTVSTYVFWNVHEAQPGQFDFSGNADVAEFCRLAQREGLKVILRPGPYVCSEWDFGGLPWWLLKDSQMRVRTRYPGFMDACRRYFMEVGRQLAPLQTSKGGPIIMVQVENEYDGYGRDNLYIAALCGALKEAGFEVPFFSSEMTWSLRKDSHEGVLRAVGFGTEPAKNFQSLRAIQPTGPLMVAECYTGWFAQWGRGSGSNPDYSAPVTTLTWLLENRASFNLYMVHGGTTFGFRSGATSDAYRPQITSFWDAPINEAGRATPKYHAMRELLAKHAVPAESLPEIPSPLPAVQISPIQFSEFAPVFENLPEAKKARRPQFMESYDQPHGCILYRTKLPAGSGERLVIRELHDYALVFLEGKKIASLYRGWKQDSVALPARTNETTLDILVEAMGRINYGEQMHDRKGITEKVELVQGRSPRELFEWEVFNLPLYGKDLASLKFKQGQTDDPAFYRARFNVSEVGDTFLDMRQWNKGVVWVNGHNLGRFWAIGPQQTLYCPAPWLKRGANEVVVLELNGTRSPTVAGLTEPVMNQVNLFASGRVHRSPDQTLQLAAARPYHAGEFSPEPGFKTVRFKEVRGRYICLEATSSHLGDAYTTCAELELLDAAGHALQRDNWKIVFADSEEVGGEDGSAANVFDGRADTFWHTEWDAVQIKHPHQLVIDLGREETLTGFRYLPRQDLPNGRIRDYRLFVSAEPLVTAQ